MNIDGECGERLNVGDDGQRVNLGGKGVEVKGSLLELSVVVRE